MAQRVRSQKQAQRRLADVLRSAGKTWGEVAAVFCDEYGVNARVALRLAHGWSQGDAADRWNARWPDDPKRPRRLRLRPAVRRTREHAVSRHDHELRLNDWFCGAGGSTQAIASIPGVRPIHAANHWDRAIESHAANFPTSTTTSATSA
jgi:hypothetical protein